MRKVGVREVISCLSLIGVGIALVWGAWVFLPPATSEEVAMAMIKRRQVDFVTASRSGNKEAACALARYIASLSIDTHDIPLATRAVDVRDRACKS